MEKRGILEEEVTRFEKIESKELAAAKKLYPDKEVTSEVKWTDRDVEITIKVNGFSKLRKKYDRGC